MAARIPINCIKCHRSIKKHNSLHALQQTWHKDCFRCSICRTKLHEEFFSRKNALYCRQHYLENYAHSCHKCFKKVTGLIMISGDVSFHPECFRCMKCRCVIGHGDNYVFEERSQLYCCDCYEVDIGKYMKYKEFKTFHKTAIHQVHISPSKIKQSRLAFKYRDPHKENVLIGLQKKLTSKNKHNRVSIISCEDDNSLQTGDIVLEINGTPITSNNIKQFSELLESADTSKRISVTIERVPNSTNSTNTNDNKGTSQKNNNTPAPPDPEIYKRNMSYFNFDVVRKRTESMVTAEKRVRSKSLGDIQTHRAEDDRFLIKQDMMTTESPLHRAQSLKVEPIAHNQIFRPTDIEFREIVGQGFFGEVIKIVHKVSGKEMVVKKLLNMDAQALEPFLKEIHVLKSLRHPNVLQFVGVMYKDTILHLILEYIQGGTLRKLLKHKFVELPWDKKIHLAKDIATGMAYLHSQHVMHRDLKSKNVLIKKQGGGYTAVVADFGLVSIMRETRHGAFAPGSPRTYKRRNTVVGSPYWMAPEMLHGKPYDEAVDIFSYGIVMCEIISRLNADPEEIPRTKDYGLDIVKFKQKIDENCPGLFLQLTEACCSMHPEQRPPFSCCDKWLDVLLTSLKFEIPLPDVLNFSSEPKQLRLKSMSAESKEKFKELQKVSKLAATITTTTATTPTTSPPTTTTPTAATTPPTTKQQ